MKINVNDPAGLHVVDLSGAPKKKELKDGFDSRTGRKLVKRRAGLWGRIVALVNRVRFR